MLRSVVIFCALCVVAFGAPQRIVNGTDAKEGQYPYVVSVRRREFKSHTCGGSILNENWILTAAHCVYRYSVDAFSVQYGVTKISENGDTIVNVKNFFIHEDYDPFDSFVNDIAVLQLEHPLVFNKFVQPIALAKNYSQAVHETPATLVGWGVNATGEIQEHLQQLHYQIVGWKECAKIHISEIYETHICAAFPGYGKAQCSGDSGGPLTVNGAQVGIVSWSEKPCGIARYPGVFTQVSFYRDWIRNKTGV
uniref:Putative trypsin-like serine protease n=1 Tax=Xenopsylla cheopis TaxID=163159 RepID=A0A6M2DW72_XENCH